MAPTHHPSPQALANFLIGADPELSQLGLVDDERHRANDTGTRPCSPGRRDRLPRNGLDAQRPARREGRPEPGRRLADDTTVDQACAGGAAAAP